MEVKSSYTYKPEGFILFKIVNPLGPDDAEGNLAIAFVQEKC